MRVFIGVDPRDVVSYQVLRWSIERRARKPVSVVPLIRFQLPITRTGLTEFTYTRYAVPLLCGYKGRAVFMDSDMLCLTDICELFETPMEGAVALVKHEQRFEWPSLMLFDCGKCKRLTAEYINDPNTRPQSFEWAENVDALDPRWNHVVGYTPPRDDAWIVHYTAGTPGFRELRGCEYTAEWLAEREHLTYQDSWLAIHGRSVHRDKVEQAIARRVNGDHDESRARKPTVELATPN